MDTIERRVIAGTELRVERREDGQPVIRGTAIVFDKLSEDLGGFKERIAPDVTIEFDPELVSLFNHDANLVLGRVPGTMRVERTDQGVTYEVTPSEARADVVAAIERGDVRGNSFMFRVGADHWDRQADGSEIRTVNAMSVMEMGPVVFPAYRDTDVAIAKRSRDAWHDEEHKASAGEMRRRRLATL